MPREQEYTKLTDSNDRDNVPFLAHQEYNAKGPGQRPCLLLLLLVLFFGGSVLFFIASVKFMTVSNIDCARKLSAYSPMMEAVEYYEVDWANKFRQPSVYRGAPTPALENAWDELWRRKHPAPQRRISPYSFSVDNDINVPLDQLHLLNRSEAANEWKLTPESHGGGVRANVEVFHQLHCLNMIRQFTYLDSYETRPEGFRVSDELSRTHVDHCIETLRIALMCTGDVTPVLIRLDESRPLGADADFETHHKCRRFDRLTDWMKLHSVPMEH